MALLKKPWNRLSGHQGLIQTVAVVAEPWLVRGHDGHLTAHGQGCGGAGWAGASGLDRVSAKHTERTQQPELFCVRRLRCLCKSAGRLPLGSNGPSDIKCSHPDVSVAWETCGVGELVQLCLVGGRGSLLHHG